MSGAKRNGGSVPPRPTAAEGRSGRPRGQWAATAPALIAVVAVFFWPDDELAIRNTAENGIASARPAANASPAIDRSDALPKGSPAATVSFALEPIGEIALAGGDVERTYAVRVVNDASWRPDAAVEIGATDLRVAVVDGRAELGDLAPGSERVSVDKVTLRHAAALSVDAAFLQWRLVAGEPRRAKGTLLAGPRDRLAIEALRDYDALRLIVLDAPAVPVPPGQAPPGRNPLEPQLLAIVAAETATIDAVNRALLAAGAAIVDMRPAMPTLALAVPGQRGADVLAETAEQLRSSGAFEWVWPIASARHDTNEDDELPPPDPEPEFDDHRSR